MIDDSDSDSDELCEDKKKKKDCKADSNCKWKQKDKACVTISAATEGGGTITSVTTNTPTKTPTTQGPTKEGATFSPTPTMATMPVPTTKEQQTTPSPTTQKGPPTLLGGPTTKVGETTPRSPTPEPTPAIRQSTFQPTQVSPTQTPDQVVDQPEIDDNDVSASPGIPVGGVPFVTATWAPQASPQRVVQTPTPIIPAATTTNTPGLRTIGTAANMDVHLRYVSRNIQRRPKKPFG